MITIVIPIFNKIGNESNDSRDIIVQTDEVFNFAINFYKYNIGIIEDDYEYFLIDGSYKVEINFGLLKSEIEIEYQKNKAGLPLFSYNINSNMLSFVNKLHNQNIKILSLVETLGGYVLQFMDPFFNVIQIKCENFDDENLKFIDTSGWNFYKRI